MIRTLGLPSFALPPRALARLALRRLGFTALIVALVVVALALTGCPKPEAGAPMHDVGPSSQPAHDEAAEGEAAKDREQADADGVVRRGLPLTASLEATPVSVVVAKASELDGKKVKLTGKVVDVCTKMGCWFVVQGDKPEDKIRISTRAHNVFVPRAAVGMTAVVEGTLSLRTLDAKDAEHMSAESAAGTVTAGKEIAIDVAGLEMKKPG